MTLDEAIATLECRAKEFEDIDAAVGGRSECGYDAAAIRILIAEIRARVDDGK